MRSDIEIYEGSLMRLKSGGPSMTVTAVTDDERGKTFELPYEFGSTWPVTVHCIWFDGSRQCTGKFKLPMLIPVTD